jgi:hypothetical protein
MNRHGRDLDRGAFPEADRRTDLEHARHEGNYGLFNTLAGARLEEKKAAEEAAKKGSK